jgi:transcriptional regulator with XRE-family HTH domain
MKVNIGEKIKNRAIELRIGTTELAKIVNTSKQNIYGIYKRESIDSALLYKLSKALKYDFFTYFINTKLPPHTDAVQNTKKDKKYPDLEDQYLLTQNQLLDLQEKYELLKKVNTLLEEKKKK